jgi:predicted nicotinamide N-methyase
MTAHGTAHGAALVTDLERRFLTVNDDIRVGNHAINVIRPRSADDLIIEADFERDERLPYWAELWPSSTVLGDFVITDSGTGKRAIELGCGVGLVSIAATLAGHTVLATDYYAEALAFTRANAFRNLGREIETHVLDWRAIPEAIGRFDLVLASDVLYESRYADLVAKTIARVLAPQGEAYVADPGRVATGAFVDACHQLGLTVTTCATRPYLAGKIRQTITVYRVTSAAVV